MPLKLPDFSDPFLKTLSFCVRTEESGFAFESRDSRDAQYGDSFWIHVVREGRAEKYHFHINLWRSVTGPAPENSLDEVLDLISQVHGQTATAWIRAIYSIPKERRPKKGIVPALSDVSMEVADNTLSLMGAKFKFSDDPFDELSLEDKPDGSLEVDLDAFVDLQVDDDCLVSAEQRLRAGLKQFVLAEAD